MDKYDILAEVGVVANINCCHIFHLPAAFGVFTKNRQTNIIVNTGR